MRKDVFGILGVLISIIGFSIYYSYAYFHYDSITKTFDAEFKPVVGTLNYITLMLGMSLILLHNTINSITKARFLIYGSGSVLWAAIAISYIFKDVFHLIDTKLFIISTAILCTVFGLILYAYRYFRR